MAGEINFGILDPKLGASFAIGYNEAEDRRNELAARVQQRALGEQQLQHAMSQNELSKYTLSTAKRSDAQQEALNARVSSPDFNPNNPAHLQELMRFGSPGQAMLKSIMDRAASEATLAKTKGEITAQDLKAAKDRHDALAGGLAPLAAAAQAGKQITHDDVYGVAQQLLNQGIISQKDLASIPMQAERLPQYILGLATSNDNSRKALEAHMAKPVVAGGNIVNMNPIFNPIGTSLANVSMTAGQKAANEIAQGQLDVSRGNLNVNRAGLGIRAIAADPYNISGVQAAFPIPGAAPGGIPSPTEKQPSGAPVLQNPAAAMKAGLTGEDFLTHLPKQVAAQVRAIGEGRESSPAARSLTTPAGRQLMDLVNTAYPGYDAKQYGVMSAAEKEFTSRKKGDTTRALNVAVDHLGTLQQVSDALENRDTRLFNQAGNFIALQTGHPAPTDFAAVKRIVADELTKAVLGSAGALGDRTAVDSALNSANSPAQLKQVIDRYKQLMGGQLNGLEQQYTASTGKKDFRDRFLTPATRAALGVAAPASAAPAAAAASVGVKFLGFEPGKP